MTEGEHQSSPSLPRLATSVDLTELSGETWRRDLECRETMHGDAPLALPGARPSLVAGAEFCDDGDHSEVAGPPALPRPG